MRKFASLFISTLVASSLISFPVLAAENIHVGHATKVVKAVSGQAPGENLERLYYGRQSDPVYTSA